MDAPNQPLASQQHEVQQRALKVRPYNTRMAKRMAKRAKLPEDGVAVAFTFNNLLTMVVFSIIEDIAKVIPTLGDLIEMLISLVSFYWHRVVLVTDSHVYIYRDLPFHRPGAQLHVFERGPGLLKIGSPKTGWWSKFVRRGQLTFSDGTVVYHGILWIKRARYIAQEGNIAAK
ncbi:MAG: hypothetical protein ACJ72L_16135 [Marmoricola sp.]